MMRHSSTRLVKTEMYNFLTILLSFLQKQFVFKVLKSVNFWQKYEIKMLLELFQRV